jgi:hypothetical protein
MDFRCDSFQAERARRRLGLMHIQYGGGIPAIGHDRYMTQTGDHLMQ